MGQQIEVRTIDGVSFVRRTRSCSVLGGHPFHEVHELVTVGDGHKPRVNPPIRFDRSPGERFTEFLNLLKTPDPVEIDPPDPLRDEIERFSEAFPLLGKAIAKGLKFAEPRGVGLFKLGSVVASRLLPLLRVTRPDIMAILDRFDAGDFGDHGKIGDVILTDDHRFAPALFRPIIRNAVAIEAGNGLVVGSYSLAKILEGRGPSPATSNFSPWLHAQDGESIQVVTLLCGNHSKTAIGLSREGTVGQ